MPPSADVEETIPGFSSVAGSIGGVLIVFGLLALAWTVIMIWGSIRALTGRSRVLLLVGGSIALAFTALIFFASLGSIQDVGGGTLRGMDDRRGLRAVPGADDGQGRR